MPVGIIFYFTYSSAYKIKRFFCLEKLAAIPEFAHLGPLFKSSTPTDLTEPETEYSIKCIKHTFSGYIVFQVSFHLMS